METISIDMLSAEIAKSLSNYEQNIKKGIDISSQKVAKKTVKTLKATSPKLTEDYLKGWKYDQSDYFSASSKVTTVYNSTNWQLTHLLEKGYIIRSGKNAGQRSKLFPHIKPAEEQAVLEFVQEVKEAIENASTSTV